MMPRDRRQSLRTPLKTLRIFCEGEKTEPNYINEYLQHFRDDKRAAGVKVEKCNKNTPVELVKDAIDRKNSRKSLAGDEFWVVYDREAASKYPREKHVEAWNIAKAGGIKIALSNVCFEFWILLHFLDSSAPYSSYDNLIAESSLRKEFKTRCKCDYDKASPVLFNHIKEWVDLARESA